MPRRKTVMGRIGTSAPSLSEQVIEAVHDSIGAGRLVPGELYSVYQLADDLGISRSPVREALLRLSETGIIYFERNRGFRIQVPGPREIAETFAVRLALEVPAARLAASKVSPEDLLKIDAQLDLMEKAASRGDERQYMHNDQLLHDIILDIAGNHYAKKIIENIRSATRLVGTSTFKDRTLTEVCQEHFPIIQALRAKDSAAAALAMEHHIKTTGRLLLRKAMASAGITEAGREAEGEHAVWTDVVGDQ